MAITRVLDYKPQVTSAHIELPEEQRRRFEIECEFVQSLANPHYLNFLAQRGYFKEDYFIAYLKYLLYWKKPEYSRCLKYPQCLYFLESVQSPSFREALTSGANAKFIEDQQLLQWHYYLRKAERLRAHAKAICEEPKEAKGTPSSDTGVKDESMEVDSLPFFTFLSFSLLSVVSPSSHDQLVDLPTRCESCAIFSREFEHQSSKSVEKSEVAAIELLENICGSLLGYKVHNDKAGLARFSRSESLTMSTLKQLKERGVKVELGMPEEMWDSPSAEITELKQQCELIVSQYEDELTEWFMGGRRDTLTDYICRSRFLRSHDSSCLPLPSSDEL